MKKSVLAMLGSTCLVSPVPMASALAQSAPQAAVEEAPPIIVTGSRIKRQVQDSPLPLQIFTTEDLRRDSVNSPEQFISLLTSNGNGLDNLASNADVVAGAARGNNGASSANLRNQGASGTLILLNGRRVPAHGLNGGVVDVNQIPLFAMERIEVLKDGASAIYGTDAVGGVINFITKKDFVGFNAQGFLDVTEGGGGNIFRGSVMGGYGDLDNDGFNVMAGVSISDHKSLRGNQRSFVNTFQPDRGLSPDTRGTPFATIFPLGTGPNTPAGTVIASAGTAPFVPGSTTIRASGGINPLDLPGGAGCATIDGQGPYDDKLWDFPQAQFACAWDTGRAAVLQQPIQTITYIGRATFRAADHEFFAELSGSEADSAKRFSNLQITPNTTTQNYAFPRTTANAAVYDRVFNQLVGTFPTLEPRRGLPLAYRWRCIECGVREIETTTRTLRFAAGAEGPIISDWNYRVGASYGYSESDSTLGSGYYYRNTTRDASGAIIANGIIDALNTGIINPFLLPGESQSAEAIALLQGASAEGVVLYGGKYDLWQIDASVSGSLFELPGGTAQAAFGVDYRIEDYSFNGDQRAAAARPVIIAAPFDNANALPGASRTVKAAYVEALFPIFTGFELTGALRIDDYTGFGSTTNPKIAARYRPIDQVMFRGGYNTSFRVPSFNQIFNGVLVSPFPSRDLADPGKCPGGKPNSTTPGCEVVQPEIISGGRRDLGPETAEQFSLGVVFEPAPGFYLSVDWWRIEREGTVRILDLLTQLVPNYDIFQDQFIRDAAGNLVAIDNRWLNSGGQVTEGIEISARGSGSLGRGNWTIGLDGTALTRKRTKLIEGADYGESEIGVFSFSGDLGLKWRHNLFLTYGQDDWSVSLSQIFRKGYENQVLPGVASGVVSPPEIVENVADYVIYNLSVSYTLSDRITFTGGVKNLFDKDPPFAISYDSSTGAGSSWEPRVADPRGRSFTLLVDIKL
jgi:iron complex outermembrane recepter protein